MVETSIGHCATHEQEDSSFAGPRVFLSVAQSVGIVDDAAFRIRIKRIPTQERMRERTRTRLRQQSFLPAHPAQW